MNGEQADACPFVFFVFFVFFAIFVLKTQRTSSRCGLIHQVQDLLLVQDARR